MPTVNELASQELAKRYSLSGRTQMMPMAPEPADRGYFGVTGALTDYGTGMRDAGGSALRYMLDTSLADMGRDAVRFGGAMVEGMVEDPLMTAVDLIPGAGLAMGAYEAEQLRAQALEAERAGQLDLAQSLRSQAGAIAAMSAIPGGRTARRGSRMNMANEIEDTWSQPPRTPSPDEKIIDIPISMIEHGEGAMPGGTLSFPNAQETIQEYAKRKTEIPAINVLTPEEMGDQFFMVEDGSRRLEAAKLRGDKTIKAIVPKDYVYPESEKTIRSSLTDFMAETFPKDYGSNIVEPYVRAGIDPRTFSAGSGSTGKPRVSDIDRNLSTQIQYGDQRIQTIPEINLEDYEGYPFMSSISDTSGAGDVIQSIDGVPVNVSRRGGQDYMFDPLSEDFVWASARNVVKGAKDTPPPGSLFGRALALKERTGKDPLFIPHSMTPTGSDFSQVADVMLSYARNNMSKSNIKQLDKEIKSIIPDWPGLGDESFNQVLNRVGGAERKKIIDLLDKKYIDKGSLTAGQGRLAISDESQRIIRPGTLRNVGIVDTSRAPIVGSPHPVYDTGLYGAGIGRLSQPLSVYELNPAAAYLGGITPDQLMNPPRSTGRQGGLRSLEGAPLSGIITEDVLRGIEMRRAMAE